MGFVVTVGVFGAAVAVWILLGLLKAIRDLLAERAATWLLPARQPATFRLALLVAFAARALAPRRIARFGFLGGDWPGESNSYLSIAWSENSWADPDSAIAELEADLRAEQRVLKPLRLVIPLLATAAAMKGRNLLHLVRGATLLPIVIVLMLLMLFPFLGEELPEWFEDFRRWRRRRRIVRARAKANHDSHGDDT